MSNNRDTNAAIVGTTTIDNYTTIIGQKQDIENYVTLLKFIKESMTKYQK